MLKKNYEFWISGPIVQVGGWVAVSPSDNRANLSLTATEVGLPTWTELGNLDLRAKCAIF